MYELIKQQVEEIQHSVKIQQVRMRKWSVLDSEIPLK